MKEEEEVLIADSHHVDRMQLASYLRKRGRTPLCAATIREAKELTMQYRPAIAVVNFFLDGHAALSLVEFLLASAEDVRVIMTAEFSSAHAVIASFRVGAFDFHEKPVSPHALYRSIEGSHGKLEVASEFCSLKQLEKEHISRVLFAAGGNVTAAAKILQVHRQSLQRKLRGEGGRARPA